MDVTTVVRQYILENHLPGQPDSALPEDAPLLTTGILDSIGVLGLINFLESRYQIEFLPRELDLRRLETPRTIGEVVGRKLAERAAAGGSA